MKEFGNRLADILAWTVGILAFVRGTGSTGDDAQKEFLAAIGFFVMSLVATVQRIEWAIKEKKDAP